jgi:hypothetical protein
LGTQLAPYDGVPTHPDLEALLSADEEARARVASAEREAQAIVERARLDAERRRVERERAADETLALELRRIREESEREAQARRDRREAWRSRRREAMEARLDEAARVVAELVGGGGPGGAS